jgi:hypothetical protein
MNMATYIAAYFSCLHHDFIIDEFRYLAFNFRPKDLPPLAIIEAQPSTSACIRSRPPWGAQVFVTPCLLFTPSGSSALSSSTSGLRPPLTPPHAGHSGAGHQTLDEPARIQQELDDQALRLQALTDQALVNEDEMKQSLIADAHGALLQKALVQQVLFQQALVQQVVAQQALVQQVLCNPLEDKFKDTPRTVQEILLKRSFLEPPEVALLQPVETRPGRQRKAPTAPASPPPEGESEDGEFISKARPSTGEAEVWGGRLRAQNKPPSAGPEEDGTPATNDTATCPPSPPGTVVSSDCYFDACITDLREYIERDAPPLLDWVKSLDINKDEWLSEQNPEAINLLRNQVLGFIQACCICKEEEPEPGNDILFCDGCDNAFHQKCYGVTIPKGDWFCRDCLDQKDRSAPKKKKKRKGAERTSKASRSKPDLKFPVNWVRDEHIPQARFLALIGYLRLYRKLTESAPSSGVSPQTPSVLESSQTPTSPSVQTSAEPIQSQATPPTVPKDEGLPEIVCGFTTLLEAQPKVENEDSEASSDEQDDKDWIHQVEKTDARPSRSSRSRSASPSRDLSQKTRRHRSPIRKVSRSELDSAVRRMLAKLDSEPHCE